MPNSYRTAGVRQGTATSSSTTAGTTPVAGPVDISGLPLDHL